MAERNDGVDEPGWDVDPEDEISAAVEMVGHHLKLRREAMGLRVAEFADAVGYGEDMVRKIERGVRIPRPEYLDMADELLRAGGLVAAMKEKMKEARYPKKARDLAKLEGRAVEIGLYSNHNIHGLLQTEEHMRALFEMRQPSYSQDQVERDVAARLARQAIFERSPAPALSFVQEEATLRRTIGGRMVLRRQLEHLAAVAQLRHVTFQVMPLDCENHAGMGGLIEVLKFRDGTAVGRSEGAFNSRPVSDPKQLRILELRYGMIRAQALTPRESLAFIEELLGET
ncbi:MULTISPECIES: helix-turn-helix domain-containing protein [Streptomyces]|uniref:helix-turn-helix domain-containing protein n=1 Tax=Streptomyces TaxID=1883 RepID=UPI001E5339E7|nr:MULTISPECIES: helix-turn-helix transcriptional regulator [Streptomyces]UFQ15921.1 helix-turn-helix transcriptional regulator [Streptomyces huasconensis]WCL85524.1 helix-turn-helix transcriptional regulator [Streptomyces sp. JCM 35825]